jgi:hypothetical protein
MKIVFHICLIDAVQGGISCPMLNIIWSVDFVVGHSLHCIKTKPEPSFSFVSYFLEYVIVVVSAL